MQSERYNEGVSEGGIWGEEIWREILPTMFDSHYVLPPPPLLLRRSLSRKSPIVDITSRLTKLFVLSLTSRLTIVFTDNGQEAGVPSQVDE